MKLTTIQLYENTKKKLEHRKVHPRESFDSVLKRILESESMPSMEDMFREGDKLIQKKKYSTNEVVRISHELREEN
jgi:hypothetical protein